MVKVEVSAAGRISMNRRSMRERLLAGEEK
jgi:hypothetical protein